jgi:hypothetical protein
MLDRYSPGSTRRRTLGAEKGFDSADFVADLRRMRVTPTSPRRRVVRHRPAATRHTDYASSPEAPQEDRGALRLGQDRRRNGARMLRGVERVRARFTRTMAACNMARLPRTLAGVIE